MKTLNFMPLLFCSGCLSAAIRPVNIVIINLDDVGYGDFSYNGALGYTTPNIDRLASDGVRFTHF